MYMWWITSKVHVLVFFQRSVSISLSFGCNKSLTLKADERSLSSAARCVLASTCKWMGMVWQLCHTKLRCMKFFLSGFWSDVWKFAPTNFPVSCTLYTSYLHYDWAKIIVLQSMFEPYLKSFFVHSHDPTNIKLLKVSLYNQGFFLGGGGAGGGICPPPWEYPPFTHTIHM